MKTSQKLLFIVRFIYLTFAVIVTMILFQTVSIYWISLLDTKQALMYKAWLLLFSL